MRSQNLLVKYGLLDDKEKGINKCFRVAKPEGRIGLSEATYITTSPESVRYVSRTYGVKEILTSNEWRELLINAELKDMVKIHKVYTFALEVQLSEGLLKKH